jgi:hypothetical protein
MARQNKDSLQKGLWFSILIDGDEFVAFISGEALAEHFDEAKGTDSPLTVYSRHHDQINAVAEKKFLGGCLRPIKLTTLDFMSDAKSRQTSSTLQNSLRKSSCSDGRTSSEAAQSENNLANYR